MTSAALRPLADSHVHLDRYPPEAVRGMLRRASAAGVEHLLTVGVDLASSVAAVGLARRHRRVQAAVGVHPTRVRGQDRAEALRRLGELARERSAQGAGPDVVAIGEVGLDVEAGESLAAQERFLAGCLDLAGSLRLPLVLHVVGAHARAQQVLRAHAPVRAVVHYFVGNAGLAERYLDLGCLVAVGKPATRPSATGLHEAVAGIPLDRLLLETDTYPLAGRTTEPRDVADVCSAVARIKALEPAVVAAWTTENFVRLFGVRPFGPAGSLSRSRPRPT